MSRIFLVPPPLFKGRSEQGVVEHLIKNIEPKVTLLGDLHEHDINPGKGFYDHRHWMLHQALMTTIIDHTSITSDDQILFFDFWFPGLDMVKIMLDARGVKPKLIGYLHGASFIEGDLMTNNWSPHLEKAWMTIYDVIWASSCHSVKNMPMEFRNKVSFVGEPFDPDEYQTLRNTDPEKKPYDVIYPHRLSPDKGFDELVEVIKELNKAGGRVPKVLITGACTPEHKYQRELKDYENVSYAIGDAEHAHRLRLSQAKVVLSTARQETWGHAVMKACALGCTPVLPNRAVYPEIYDEVHLFDSPSEAAKIIKSAIDEYPMGTITPLKVVVGGRLVDGILQQE